ncbi:hypothetical protein GCM10027271_08980 [Saccharopolyspora gloriosae]|uniref:Uncharacterized protein n=1 Tax=Saccharopolyspora gloriosae TaxID=455344 RepID=A0A840NR50_9PSEU|nr:hypothetical protein [Saccharopolyspora gloriosae]MBB5072445.1 hypothetical protein [Saccharopolyspora gloriosae]
MIAALVVAALLIAPALLLPLRGGTGEHAHAGPGTVTVDRLRTAPPPPTAAAAIDVVPDEEIAWPVDEPEHVGKHRLRTEEWACHRLATLLALRAHHERRPVVPSGPSPRADIRLHGAVI